MLTKEASQVLQMARIILERNAGNTLSPDLIVGMLRVMGDSVATLVKPPEPTIPEQPDGQGSSTQ